MSKYTWRKHDVEELHNSDDLQEISKLAHLAIIRLRDALWRRGGNSIKPGAVPTSILYERAEWDSVAHEVLPFFESDETGVFCPSICEQVGHVEQVREKRSKAGKVSASTRVEHMLNKHSTSVEHDVQQRRGEEIRGEENREDQKSPDGDSDSFVLESPELPKRFDPSSFWDQFQTLYPKRKGDLGKAKAKTIFYRLAKTSAAAEEIIEGVRKYRQFCESNEMIGGPFIKQMTTFLDGKCWGEEWAGDPQFTASDLEKLRNMR
jgi:hypothetical protein